MAVYQTGFCSNGQHEGLKLFSPSGKPLKVCIMWLTCGCICHTEITELFKLAGVERIAQQNPDYKPEKSPFTMPSLEERVLAAAGLTGHDTVALVDAPPRLESPAPGIVPVVVPRSYASTPTGRAARGELEAWVRTACDVWKVENYKTACTPPWLAAEIAKTHGLGRAPSTGAITSVLDRWEKIGFAQVARKPVRFLDYTEAGMELGLEALKLKSKIRKSNPVRIPGRKK